MGILKGQQKNQTTKRRYTITITNVDAPAIGRTPDRQANYAGNVHHNTAYGICGVKC